MKNHLILFAAIILAALPSLNACKAIEEGPEVSGRQMTFTARQEGKPWMTKAVDDRMVVDLFDEDIPSEVLPQTRVETAMWNTVVWSPGDEISLFQGRKYAGGSKFTCDIDEPAAVVDFSGILDSVDDGSGLAFWAISPYSDNNVCDGNAVYMTIPAEQTAVKDSFDPDAFYSVATTEDRSLRFYNVTGGLAVTFKNPYLNKTTIRGNAGETLAGQVYVAFDDDGFPVVKRIRKSETEVSLTAPDGEYFVPGRTYYISMLPVELPEGLSMTIEGPQMVAAERNFKTPVTIKRSWFGRIKWCDDTSGEPLPESPKTPVPVDLGLSIRWADMNVGANKPQDSGNYYCWGEITPKTARNDYGYEWYNKYTKTLYRYNTDEEYGEVDNLLTLSYKDDAATQAYGYDWRMPTKEEFEELITDCTWEFVGGEKPYFLVSGKKEGFTDKSIKLPCTSYNSCQYWSSSLYPYDDFSDAYILLALYTGSDVNIIKGVSQQKRWNGLSIRPVRED